MFVSEFLVTRTIEGILYNVERGCASSVLKDKIKSYNVGLGPGWSGGPFSVLRIPLIDYGNSLATQVPF